MRESVLEHVIRAIEGAPMRTFPFPHIYVESVFPEDYYVQLRRNWPSASRFVTLASTGRVSEGAYPERFIMPLTTDKVNALPEQGRAFWGNFAESMLGSSRFLFAAMDRFEPFLRARFGDTLETLDFSHEVLVVRDHSNYRLGPHTDSPRKALSLLFYCPDDSRHSHLGTSMYRPIDPAFRCDGGPHHAFEHFEKVATMEYKPNALFAFAKSDYSFHGVDPIRDANMLRDLILYDIQVHTGQAAQEHAAIHPLFPAV